MHDLTAEAVESQRPAESSCALPAPLQALVKFIFNKRMMEQQMVEIGYDAEKLPLGKLSNRTILKGFQVLKRISEVRYDTNYPITIAYMV